MKVILKIFLTCAMLFMLTACAESELTAPCPNYGQSCVKKPINSWNYPN
jgi:hypothetical protein